MESVGGVPALTFEDANARPPPGETTVDRPGGEDFLKGGSTGKRGSLKQLEENVTHPRVTIAPGARTAPWGGVCLKEGENG